MDKINHGAHVHHLTEKLVLRVLFGATGCPNNFPTEKLEELNNKQCAENYSLMVMICHWSLLNRSQGLQASPQQHSNCVQLITFLSHET